MGQIVSFRVPGFESLDLVEIQNIPGVESLYDSTPTIEVLPVGLMQAANLCTKQLMIEMHNGYFITIMRDLVVDKTYETSIFHGVCQGPGYAANHGQQTAEEVVSAIASTAGIAFY
jgi:hypothetical protein